MGYHWSQLHANRIPRWRVILVPASAVSIGFWPDRIGVGARSSGRKAMGKSPYSLRITTIRPEESLPHERSECPGCRAATPIRSGQNHIDKAIYLDARLLTFT